MIIRCYGARGSIPVSGEAYIRYGGDTTCLELRTQNDQIIIVDAGTGIRRLGTRLIEEQRFDYKLIFTHSHMDHIMGFPFFKPVYEEKTKIDMMGCPTTQGNLKKLLARAMAPPLFPIPFENLKAKVVYAEACSAAFSIDTIEISPINLSHPNVGMGYKFVEGDKTFVFLTDNELGYRHRDGGTFAQYAAFAEGADLLIHDAEYTPEEYGEKRTWGHSTYLQALDLAIEAGVKALGLVHHNQERTDAEVDAIVETCREIIRVRKSPLNCFALTQESEIVL